MKIKGLFIVMVAGALACLLMTGCKNGKVAANEKLTWQEKDGKWGMVDKNGKVVVPYEYDGAYSVFYDSVSSDTASFYLCPNPEGITPFDGMNPLVWAIFKIDEENYEMSKYGLIDCYGNFILPVEYYMVDPYRWPSWVDGLIPVGKGGNFNEETGEVEGRLWGYVNIKGEFVIPLKYDYAGPFAEDDKYTIVGLDGKQGIIDRKGNVVVPFEYDYFEHTPGDNLYPFFRDGYAVGRKDGKYGIVDTTGNFEELPSPYDGE